MHRREAHQVSFSEPKQTHSRRQTSAVLWMQGMFESLLKMNERAGGLDQPLEKICVMRVGVQPKLLKHIVRLVIAHFVHLQKRFEHRSEEHTSELQSPDHLVC